MKKGENGAELHHWKIKRTYTQKTEGREVQIKNI